jgi:hypothetical protein
MFSKTVALKQTATLVEKRLLRMDKYSHSDTENSMAHFRFRHLAHIRCVRIFFSY